jgi:hypothetical protein
MVFHLPSTVSFYFSLFLLPSHSSLFLSMHSLLICSHLFSSPFFCLSFPFHLASVSLLSFFTPDSHFRPRRILPHPVVSSSPPPPMLRPYLGRTHRSRTVFPVSTFRPESSGSVSAVPPPPRRHLVHQEWRSGGAGRGASRIIYSFFMDF